MNDKREVEVIGDLICEWCGELIRRYDDVVIKDNRVYHKGCEDCKMEK